MDGGGEDGAVVLAVSCHPPTEVVVGEESGDAPVAIAREYDGESLPECYAYPRITGGWGN